MTKSLLLITISFCLFITSNFAQTILQSNNIPMNGDVFGNKTITDTTIQPGSGGTNHVWDFSVYFIYPSVISEAFTLPGTTGNDALFPNANLKATSLFGGTDYYNRSVNELQFVGYKDASMEVIVSNQQKLLSVPLAYGDSIMNVPVTGTGVFGYALTGTISVKADGQGNLTLFSGSFTNSLRVVTTMNLVVGAGSGNDTRVDITKYTWYSHLYRNPIFQIAILDINGNLASVRKKVVTVGLPVTGIDDLRNDLGLMISPNPATETTRISFEKINSNSILTITDVTGKIVSSMQMQNGTTNLDLEVKDFSRGIYFLDLIDGDRVSRRKLILN